jgi:hypothetical protein
MNALFKSSVILSEGERGAYLSGNVCRARVEGPAFFYRMMAEKDSSPSMQSCPAGLSRQGLVVGRTSAIWPPRSFDSGAAVFSEEKHAPLAFAQDDGAFFLRGGPVRRGLRWGCLATTKGQLSRRLA